MVISKRRALLLNSLLASMLLLTSCAKDESQQSEFVIDEYSETEDMEEDTSEQAPQSYSMDEEISEDSVDGPEDDDAITYQDGETSEIEEIVVPDTDELAEEEPMTPSEAMAEQPENTVETQNTKSDSSNSFETEQSVAAANDYGSEQATYIVKPNDTLAKIAEKLLNSSGAWKKLAADNNISDPSRIYPGDVIKYSTQANNASLSTNSSNPSQYVVNKGDSLGDISLKLYGSADYWKVLYRWNESNIKSPDLIYPSQVIMYFGKSEMLTSSDMDILSANKKRAH